VLSVFTAEIDGMDRINRIKKKEGRRKAAGDQ
jgi:hypothetical protein